MMVRCYLTHTPTPVISHMAPSLSGQARYTSLNDSRPTVLYRIFQDPPPKCASSGGALLRLFVDGMGLLSTPCLWMTRRLYPLT
jgi:hypothetical protein